MSLKVGLLSVSELYDQGVRRRVTGVSLAAKVLMTLFDYAEQLMVVGSTPRAIKQQVMLEAAKHNVELKAEQISFCRFGQIHPSYTLYLDEALVAGEAFTFDIWLEYAGYHADLARIIMLPPYQPQLLKLQRGALAVQEAAVKAVKSGDRLLSVVQAAQQAAAKAGVFIVEGACGHGLGRALHEAPEIAFCYNAGDPFSRFKSGAVITIEPLVSLSPACLQLHDNEMVTLSTDVPFFYAEVMVYVGDQQSVVIGR